MEVQCPHCGKSIAVNGIGRKPLNIAVKIVYDTLWLHRSVMKAAEKLGCSRAYIYQELRKNGLRPKDIINERGNLRQVNYSTNERVVKGKGKCDITIRENM